ncbi:MAG TPA: DUF4864 domain-containing protein [Burkholderiales bacterium]|nr:DUF4864 domain-containing protein [Burkholderiales bacterium]
MQMLPRLIAVLCLILPFLAFGADAQVSAGDSRAIRAVIRAQLDAFAHEDGPKAFSYASADIREQFGDADSFMEMVRSSYPVVYRPASVDFLPPTALDGEVLQQVRMVDAAGRLWLARYHMEKQKDGAWRIAGCDLGLTGGTAT